MRGRRAAGVVGPGPEALVAGKCMNPDLDGVGHGWDGAAEDAIKHTRRLDAADAVLGPGAVEGDAEVHVELVWAEVTIRRLPVRDDAAAAEGATVVAVWWG